MKNSNSANGCYKLWFQKWFIFKLQSPCSLLSTIIDILFNFLPFWLAINFLFPAIGTRNNGQQLTVISQNSQTKLIAWNWAETANRMFKKVKKRKRDRSIIVFHFPFRKLKICCFYFILCEEILVCAILVIFVDIPKMFVPFKLLLL